MSSTDSVDPQTAPLAPERVASLKSLLEGLHADQLLWIEGYINNLRSTGGVNPELTVLSTVLNRATPKISPILP